MSTGLIFWAEATPFGTIPTALGWQSGSLAIISKRVGLERVLSTAGGGEIGLRRPAERAELNLLKEDGKASRFAAGAGESMKRETRGVGGGNAGDDVEVEGQGKSRS